MWKWMIDAMLRRMMVEGRLDVIWPDGTRTGYGPGGGSGGAPGAGPGTGPGAGLSAEIRLTDAARLRDLALKPVLVLGEGYMDGWIEIADDAVYETLALLVHNQEHGAMPGWFNAVQALRTAARGLVQRNNAARSARNVQHHYDISDDFYRRFLDEDMQYSCAYFERRDMTLEQAQAAKKAHIGRKLMIEPGMRVLDIGCGWGGMALTLARDFGARVVGVTLSENQLATARARAEAAGLSGQVEFRLTDYRALDERFDRIVSVGMLEHVGLPQLPTYFGKVHELLAEDGISLIHTIGNTGTPHATSPWIQKYIFPGGYVPTLSELAPAIERAGLWTADIEVWRGHYGPTLRHWRQRFEAQLDWVRSRYDERFVRMWRFYLAACEAAFEESFQAVFHLQLSRRQYAVPVTRDYLYAGKAEPLLHAAQ